MNDSPAALAMRGVRKTFEAENAPVRALRGVDLVVSSGEFVALLGPSGCGKSTLLNLAAGLIMPLAGEIDFAGKPLLGLNRNVGYMTQGDTLLPWMSVAKNILLPLELRSDPKAERDKKLERALTVVNLVSS